MAKTQKLMNETSLVAAMVGVNMDSFYRRVARGQVEQPLLEAADLADLGVTVNYRKVVELIPEGQAEDVDFTPFGWIPAEGDAATELALVAVEYAEKLHMRADYLREYLERFFGLGADARKVASLMLSEGWRPMLDGLDDERPGIEKLLRVNGVDEVACAALRKKFFALVDEQYRLEWDGEDDLEAVERRLRLKCMESWPELPWGVTADDRADEAFNHLGDPDYWEPYA